MDRSLAAGVDRRGFLGLAGLAALAACSSDSGSRPVRPSASTPMSSASTSSPPNWAALKGKPAGTLVLPGDPAYPQAQQLYDFRFDAIRPQAIAYCESVSHVQRCLEVARASSITPRPRCGGHSYGGWSTGEGLVIDATRMANVAADASSNTATVGAGARLVDV